MACVALSAPPRVAATRGQLRAFDSVWGLEGRELVACAARVRLRLGLARAVEQHRRDGVVVERRVRRAAVHPSSFGTRTPVFEANRGGETREYESRRRNGYWHEPSSVLALARKLLAVESVQPLATKTQPSVLGNPSEGSERCAVHPAGAWHPTLTWKGSSP